MGKFLNRLNGLVGIVIAIVLIAVLFAVCTANDANATKPNPDHKVTLCHRTGSEAGGNTHAGYSIVTVDIASSGYVKGGHTGHEQVGNGPGGDIIPAYTYEMKNGDTFVFDGKNLDTVIGGATGAEILANGCVVPSEESPTPTPTETPSETPPPTTVPPTTEPPTTAPPTSVVVPPADCVGNDKPARCFSNVPKAGGDLAFTGLNAGWAALLGLGFLGAGGTALYIARRKSLGLDS